MDRLFLRRLAQWLLLALSLARSDRGMAARADKPGSAMAKAAAQAEVSPADALMIRWEEEAMRRGKFVCLNPAHHHHLSPQMHMLIEEDLNH